MIGTRRWHAIMPTLWVGGAIFWGLSEARAQFEDPVPEAPASRSAALNARRQLALPATPSPTIPATAGVPAAPPAPPLPADGPQPEAAAANVGAWVPSNRFDGPTTNAPTSQLGKSLPPLPGGPETSGVIPGAPATPPGVMPGQVDAGQVPPTPAPTLPPGAEAAEVVTQPDAAAAGDAFSTAVGTAAPGFGGATSGGGAAFTDLPMIGDQSPIRFRSMTAGMPAAMRLTAADVPNPPPVPRPGVSTLFYPTIRTFKVSENMSPRPQDRIFFNYNWFTNVNAAQNRADQVPIRDMTVYRWLFGLEKTFFDGKGSLGMRLPLNTLTANATKPDISTPTSTALGNLTIFGKYILEENKETGSLASVGLAITPPTGPSRFANAPYVYSLNTITFQPFFGYILRHDRFYLQGFSAFDFPANPNEVTLMYNDVAVGYFLVQRNDPSYFLTALAPTFEVHVNTPFNHRNLSNRFDPAATPDVVNFTYGVNFEFYRQAVLTTAFIHPVTSNKPFDTELAVLLNIYYGRTRRSLIPQVPPVL